jgi:hypothetical protein
VRPDEKAGYPSVLLLLHPKWSAWKGGLSQLNGWMDAGKGDTDMACIPEMSHEKTAKLSLTLYLLRGYMY